MNKSDTGHYVKRFQVITQSLSSDPSVRSPSRYVTLSLPTRSERAQRRIYSVTRSNTHSAAGTRCRAAPRTVAPSRLTLRRPGEGRADALPVMAIWTRAQFFLNRRTLT